MGGLKSAFGVRVIKDGLVFSAAHFITFNGNICERLHGHNWRVEAAIEGELDENCYVFDFIAAPGRLAETGYGAGPFGAAAGSASSDSGGAI